MPKPIYYSFHPATGELLEQGTCDESPLEPGVFLTPGSSTLETPPSTNPGYVPVWDQEAQRWTVMRDCRGETRWAAGKGFVRITKLGDPADHGLPPITVRDAQHIADLDSSDRLTRIRMWINDDVVEFYDDPALLERQVLAMWEDAGGVIRPANAPDGEVEEEPAGESGDALLERLSSVETRLDRMARAAVEGGANG